MIGVGEYARVSDGIVFVGPYDQGRYETVRVDRDEECSHSASELTPWSPAVGERVCELNNEDSVIGTVLKTSERTSLVKWDNAAEPEVWRNSQLEPACV